MRGRELLPSNKGRPLSRFARFSRAMVIGIAITYCVLCALLWNREAHFIFFPSRVIDLTPANFGAKFEQVKEVRGRGLMIGIELPEELAHVRKELLFKHHIFTGEAKPNVIRLLPALNLTKAHADRFLEAFTTVLNHQLTHL